MNKYIILGHENPDVDSIISGYLLEKILKYKGFYAEFVIPDKRISEESYKICLKFGLDAKGFQRELTADDKKFILVDHYERIVSGEIVAIIDHHPIDDNNNMEDKVLYYNNMLRSSTTCFFKDLSFVSSCFNKNDWKLLILAAMVDTASFHSTKSVSSEHEWIKELCKYYEFDYFELYNAGLCLTELNNLDEVKLNGLKKYEYKNKKIECSYIQIKNVKKEQKKISTILDLLTVYLWEKRLDYFVFIVYDMDNFKTNTYYITSDGIESIDYSEYTSRGNKIIPDVYKRIDYKSNIFIASSSSNDINNTYFECASSISLVLANMGYNLSFGACSTGMMGKCYEEFSKIKREVYSYTIDKYKNDLENLNSKQEFIFNNTFDRIKELYYNADIIVFLPGGTGTLAEFFSVLEENRSISNPKQVILYNYKGYYDKVLEFIAYLIDEKFNNVSIYNYFHICNTEKDVISLLKEIRKK